MCFYSYIYFKLDDMEKLEDDDMESLRWFWSRKRDLERYEGFGQLKPILSEEMPELLEAWESYKSSEKKLNELLNC